MARALKLFLVFVLFILLTVITQTGGAILLICLLIFPFTDRVADNIWFRSLIRMATFIFVYLFFTFAIVPYIAPLFGRVPLPLLAKRHLKPANAWTCVLNRNYVRPELRELTFRIADRMDKKFPGVMVNYLDANFPFIDEFPLLPHLSHDDGKKLDLSFQYNDSQTGETTNLVPSFIGYGVCEGPGKGEQNMPAACVSKGFWQYSLLPQLVSQHKKEKFIFSNQRNREMVNAFASEPALGKIFIEPHLKMRMGLNNRKIRFHGCQAVRHDDHIHVELR